MIEILDVGAGGQVGLPAVLGVEGRIIANLLPVPELGQVQFAIVVFIGFGQSCCVVGNVVKLWGFLRQSDQRQHQRGQQQERQNDLFHCSVLQS